MGNLLIGRRDPYGYDLIIHANIQHRADVSTGDRFVIIAVIVLQIFTDIVQCLILIDNIRRIVGNTGGIIGRTVGNGTDQFHIILGVVINVNATYQEFVIDRIVRIGVRISVNTDGYCQENGHDSDLDEITLKNSPQQIQIDLTLLLILDITICHKYTFPFSARFMESMPGWHMSIGKHTNDIIHDNARFVKSFDEYSPQNCELFCITAGLRRRNESKNAQKRTPCRSRAFLG